MPHLSRGLLLWITIAPTLVLVAIALAAQHPGFRTTRFVALALAAFCTVVIPPLVAVRLWSETMRPRIGARGAVVLCLVAWAAGLMVFVVGWFVAAHAL